MTFSGLPRNLARRSSRWVATPTGQVFRWQTRNMAQPAAISAAVPKLNSSAPRIAAMTMSRPVFMPPSVRRTTRPRSPFIISTWWASATPISQEEPAFLIEARGEAPVPPSWPETRTTSA